MILEIFGVAVAGGLLAWTFLDGKGVTDASKIQRIANNCGINVKEGGKLRTIHLLRKRKYEWGTEYVYRLPLGLSFDEVKAKKAHIEDGLNHRRGILDLSVDDLRTLRIDGDIVAQIKALLAGRKHRMEIDMEYDGTLRIRVYKAPMPALVSYDSSMVQRCLGWQICVGEAREGGVFHDFDQIPHLIVAGMTRYGKSVFLKNIVTTLTTTQARDVRFTLIDLKGGLSFNRFKDLRQVETVVKNVDESLEALRKMHAEILRQQAEFLAKRYEDITEAKTNRRHFIIIDEGAELASAGETVAEVKRKKAECEHIIAEIARIGGGLGYRLIYATQYPTADTLPRQVKQNCDARLCFRLPTEMASRVVLDESGAEELPLIKGRAIYRTDRKLVVQTPFIDNEFIDRTIRPHIVIKPRKEETPSVREPTPEDRPARRYSLDIS
ncbi:FtsK/SpoIIIE domain-containing protein [Paenibacillus sp.]|uniref:FtsK/SpoIIIE domain-containing protein n=1 Tax=Paenibacillus sp. TaxID=58172 RepID=UPI002D25CCEC|nr:FtsK/SpoIIIE domain-containing protein [Paenibacillus sp.]HZG87286.1 FtsK/SpoIIIE domain-containing protein [Paenibacillus sp.]